MNKCSLKSKLNTIVEKYRFRIMCYLVTLVYIVLILKVLRIL